MPSLSDSNTIL